MRSPDRLTKEKISIITVTYDRESLLLRCMESIAGQDYDGPIEHIIVGDGSSFLRTRQKLFESYYRDRGRKIDVIILHRSRDLKRYLWERIASHQNSAVAASSGTYITDLDDDNTIAHNHLSSLEAKISEGYDAVHSWRYIYCADGTPYLLNRYPWVVGNDPLRERILFKIQCDAGIFKPGQNIIYDTLCLNYKGRELCGTVDSSEWMYRKELFTSGQLRFADDYSFEDILFGHSDDYLLNKRIRALNLKVGCTNLPTLNYYLSGSSQNPAYT